MIQKIIICSESNVNRSSTRNFFGGYVLLDLENLCIFETAFYIIFYYCNSLYIYSNYIREVFEKQRIAVSQLVGWFGAKTTNCEPAMRYIYTAINMACLMQVMSVTRTDTDS